MIYIIFIKFFSGTETKTNVLVNYTLGTFFMYSNFVRGNNFLV